ncbi:hypothetical protein Daus18300_009628 [Diaporthe australafricana]|uniref:Uncharacterized protein n=1 Tax=Diaporthe australafricana TaxID=127596 RepID=A0ABR3WDG8_9PEZI
MSVDQQEQQLLQDFKSFKASIEAPIVQKYQQEIDDLRDELAAARAEIRDLRSGHQAAQSPPFTVEDTLLTQESNDSSSESDEEMMCSVAPSTEHDQGRGPTAQAPSEETLRCYATTVAYSTYSKLCGTSDHALIQLLVDHDLQKEPPKSLSPKKMIDISRTGHNIAYLREQIANSSSLFAARMIQARSLSHPEVTTDDQVRRLGPANVPTESLQIYWIVNFSHHGMVSWEDGCRLADAYRRVFEDFGAEDVHCLVFESGPSHLDGEYQTAYSME